MIAALSQEFDLLFGQTVLDNVGAGADGPGATSPRASRSTTTYAAYTYLGAGAIVDSARPAVSGGLHLSYGTAADGYSRLDRFGRVVDQVWQDLGQTPATLDQYRYGYDRAGNRLFKENVLAGEQSTPVHLDELYSYDDLYRLIGTQRGNLSSGQIVDEVFAQDWTLDGLGNWDAFGEDSDGDGLLDVDQDRTHNAANEITAIDGASIAHDAAGNLTNDGTLKYAYDAWNRQVVVRQASDDSLVASYAYDGLNRRIAKTLADGSGTDYFYNEAWQVLEERHTNGSGQTVATDQYVWDISYIDAPVVRFHDGNTNGSYADPGDSVLYYLTDANQNITALVDASGDVLERYVYDPYGRVTITDAAWAVLPDGPDANSTAGDESAYGNEILYAGYRYDAETGNYHVRNRQYNPELGQFTVRDPWGYAAGDVNLYRYVGNGVLSITDPSGLVIPCYEVCGNPDRELSRTLKKGDRSLLEIYEVAFAFWGDSIRSFYAWAGGGIEDAAPATGVPLIAAAGGYVNAMGQGIGNMAAGAVDFPGSIRGLIADIGDSIEVGRRYGAAVGIARQLGLLAIPEAWYGVDVHKDLPVSASDKISEAGGRIGANAGLSATFLRLFPRKVGPNAMPYEPEPNAGKGAGGPTGEPPVESIHEASGQPARPSAAECNPEPRPSPSATKPTAEAVNLKAVGQLEGATPAQAGMRLKNAGFEPVETYPGRNGATNTIWRHPVTGEEVHISPAGDRNAPPGSAGAGPHVNKYGPENTHNRPLNDLNQPILKTSPKKTPEFHVPLRTSSGGPV